MLTSNSKLSCNCRYNGVLDTCYQACPDGYRDDGAGNTGLTCSKIACDAGEELSLLLCYEK